MSVVDIASAEIEPTPSFGTSIAREFILGVGKVGKNFMPIIDTDKALSVDDMAAIIAAHTA